MGNPKGSIQRRRLRYFGDPVLLQPGRPVEKPGPWLVELARDMIRVMREHEGLALAAHQVGEPVRVVVFNLEGLGEGQGHRVLVNPEITYWEGEEEDEEGCLSFPGLYLVIPRAALVEVRARVLDLETGQLGPPTSFVGTGLVARAYQHEIDHLDGVLFIMHLPPDERREALMLWRQKLLEALRESKDKEQVSG